MRSHGGTFRNDRCISRHAKRFKDTSLLSFWQWLMCKWVESLEGLKWGIQEVARTRAGRVNGKKRCYQLLYEKLDFHYYTSPWRMYEATSPKTSNPESKSYNSNMHPPYTAKRTCTPTGNHLNTESASRPVWWFSSPYPDYSDISTSETKWPMVHPQHCLPWLLWGIWSGFRLCSSGQYMLMDVSMAFCCWLWMWFYCHINVWRCWHVMHRHIYVYMLMWLSSSRLNSHTDTLSSTRMSLVKVPK